jgi:NitT/TauT family transport system ATP-binding protein
MIETFEAIDVKLRCEGLTVSYPADGASRPVLDGISLEVKSSEFVTILGPSGCGKTTFLRAISGAIRPSGGRIELIRTAPDESMQPLLVRQEHALFPWLTALENACFGLTMQKVPKSVREEKALALFERYGLSGRQNAYPDHLSLGMKQRVALIRGFLSDPPLLLMDEPFAALDAQSRLMLQQDLIALWEEREHVGVIFVTHDVEEAILLSDRIVILSHLPASIVAEIAIPLPRPRTPAITLEPAFIDLKRRILKYLGVSIEVVPQHV